MVKKETVKEVGVIGGLIGVQFSYAGNSVLQSYLMSRGLEALTIIIFSNFTTFLVLTPPSLFFERERWPRSLSFKLVTKLVLISFSGVTVFQTLYLEGMKHASASIATAMPNLCPAFIFIIAWTLGMEKVKLRCVYSRVKIGGAALCVMGAFLMTVMHSNSSAASTVNLVNPLSASQYDVVFHNRKGELLGCLLLLVAVLFLSANVTLQASVLTEVSAPVSMCAVVSLIGVISTTGLRLGLYGEWECPGPLIGYAILGGVVSGGGVSLTGWAIKEKGAVTVSMFSPIATLFSLLLSNLILGDHFYLGSFAGMALMFGGLYFVLWAKGKENCGDEDEGEFHQCEFNPQKPLLV